MAYIFKPPKKKRNENTDKRIERRKYYNNLRWRKLRLSKLSDQPLCEKCFEKDIITIGEDVHHIVSFMSTEIEYDRLNLLYDYTNLMTVCKECHQKIHNPVK